METEHIYLSRAISAPRLARAMAKLLPFTYATSSSRTLFIGAIVLAVAGRAGSLLINRRPPADDEHHDGDASPEASTVATGARLGAGHTE